MYKQAYIVVMENGKLVKWTGFAENKKHGEGLAIAHAVEKEGCQAWDIANRPIKGKE